MVFGQILGELEECEVAVRADRTDRANGLQINEVAVGRTSGDVGRPAFNLANAGAPPQRQQHLDDGAPALGVTQLTLSQANLNEFVDAEWGNFGSQDPSILSGARLSQL